MMVTKGWPPLIIIVATQMNEGMNRRMNERMGKQNVTIYFQKYFKNLHCCNNKHDGQINSNCCVKMISKVVCGMSNNIG